MQALKIDFSRCWSSSLIPSVVVFCFLAVSDTSGQLQITDQFVTLVNSFKVRVRATPQILPDNILDSLLKGTQLPIIGEENGWYQVRLPDGRTGWIHGDYGKVEEACDQLEVVSEVVRVRTQPTTESDSNARAIMGQRLHLLEKADNWYRVQIPNEVEGWVREDLVLLRPASSGISEEQESPPGDSQDAIESTQPESPDESLEVESPETPPVEKEKDKTDQEADIGKPAKGSKKPPLDTVWPEIPVFFNVVAEVGSHWFTVTVVTALLTALVIAVVTILRKRRLKSIHHVIRKGRSKETDLKQTLIREMEEAQKRLDSLEKEVQGRFTDFLTGAGDSNALSSKTSEDLLTSLEELRRVIQNQQKRMDLYSELVRLQNEQIEAYRQENSSIKKLLELKEGN